MIEFISEIEEIEFIGDDAGAGEGGGVPFSPSLDFSDARNSQYIGQVI